MPPLPEYRVKPTYRDGGVHRKTAISRLPHAAPGQAVSLRVQEADSAAAQTYLETQAPMEAAWAKALGLDAAALQKETTLVALVDALSLALCGELKTPIDLEAPNARGGTETLRLIERPGHPFHFVLSPWPLRTDVLTVEGEARPLPAAGRFDNEAAMRTWLKSPERTVFRAHLMSKSAI